MNHYRDLRLFVNAGMNFPSCRSNEELLDLEFDGKVVIDKKEVDCEECKAKALTEWPFTPLE